MRRPDLAADPLGAAIHARPPEAPRPVWIHVEHLRRWCVLRSADPAAPTVTLCLLELAAGARHVRTTRPHNTCPACETEIAARTPGAAVAIDPAPVVSRASTPNLRRPPVALGLDALLGPDARGEWEER